MKSEIYFRIQKIVFKIWLVLFSNIYSNILKQKCEKIHEDDEPFEKGGFKRKTIYNMRSRERLEISHYFERACKLIKN